MSGPHPLLMKCYGTEDVFLAKTAGAAPIVAQLGLSILNYHLADSRHADNEDQRQQNDARYYAARAREDAEMHQARENLRHTDVPAFVPAGSSLPAGFDEGMVRLASIAASAGAEFAKHAGIGDFASLAKLAPKVPAAGDLLSKGKSLLSGGLGLKTNLLLAGGTLAAGAATKKALPAISKTMSHEQGPATYGSPSHGVGYQVPFGVNQYGVPQVGTPLG